VRGCLLVAALELIHSVLWSKPPTCWLSLIRRRQDPSANWPMSSVSTALSIAALIAYPFRTAGSCRPSRIVGPPHWVATWSSATCVAFNIPPMTRAVTATVPSVNPWPKHAGSKNKSQNSFPWAPSTRSLPCLMSSTPSCSEIKEFSSTSCFKPSPRLS